MTTEPLTTEPVTTEEPLPMTSNLSLSLTFDNLNELTTNNGASLVPGKVNIKNYPLFCRILIVGWPAGHFLEVFQ